MKNITLVLGAAIAGATSSQLQAMPIEPVSDASPMVVQVASGCGPGRYRGPGGACHWYGRGLYPGGYYGPYRRPYWAYGGPGPETAAATGGIAVQAAPVIRLGEGPFPAAITAPIDTKRPVEKGPAPFLAEALREAPAFGSLRQVAFHAAIRRFSAFSASASASRLVAKDISERSWAWPERKSVQR